MKAINLEHNLTDVELEETLTKALKSLVDMRELDKDLPEGLANDIKTEAEDLVGKVLDNMTSEIRNVLLMK
ncbi:hypothetical protein F373_gp136 [Bacillus phage SP-10]|uniref:hypothetical protein n=1 Tax=Bacillus phage SP10 TaxID=941058 RepID=UPI0002198B5C|nr:hypothetical protein F373_gp136 [Bacillus phage SP-10]BAK52948.1 hypothetical protein [Bacillus phage SP-10]